MGDISVSTETSTSELLGLPRAAQWNYGNISSDVPLESLEMNSNLVRKCHENAFERMTHAHQNKTIEFALHLNEFRLGSLDHWPHRFYG